MSDPFVYDKAKYHYDGNFPEELPDEQAFVHTGLYLGWIIDRNLYSAEFAQDFGDLIRRFRAREVTGPQVFQKCDGVLLDDMLDEQGNTLSRQYFDFDSGEFLADYEEALAGDLPTLYHVPDSWENYEKLRVILDARFDAWRGARS